MIPTLGPPPPPDTDIITSPPLLLGLSHLLGLFHLLGLSNDTQLHPASTSSAFISTIRARPVFNTASQWPREAVVTTAGRFSFIHSFIYTPSILPATSRFFSRFPVLVFGLPRSPTGTVAPARPWSPPSYLTRALLPLANLILATHQLPSHLATHRDISPLSANHPPHRHHHPRVLQLALLAALM